MYTLDKDIGKILYIIDNIDTGKFGIYIPKNPDTLDNVINVDYDITLLSLQMFTDGLLNKPIRKICNLSAMLLESYDSEDYRIEYNSFLLERVFRNKNKLTEDFLNIFIDLLYKEIYGGE